MPPARARRNHWETLRRLHSRSVIIRRWLRMEQASSDILEMLSRASVLQVDQVPWRSATHSVYLQKLRLGTRAAAATNEARLTAAAGMMAKQAVTDVAQGAAVVSVASEAEASQLELWQQGDESLYTAEKLQARMRLRRDRRVGAALQMWWETAQQSYDDGDPQAGTIAFEGYARMHRRLYRVVLKKFDADDAARSIEVDWSKDTKGREGALLSRVDFYDSLFEVCAAHAAVLRTRSSGRDSVGDRQITHLCRALPHA